MLAPIAAAIVLVGGIAVLMTSRGSDEPEVITTPRIAEVNDPDEPSVETTTPTGTAVEATGPIPTSPPLVSPTTAPTDATDTTPATTGAEVSTTDGEATGGGPTQAQLDAALLTITDLGEGDWTEEPAEFDEVCGTVTNEDVADARSDALFQTLVTEPFSVRQVSNTLLTFPTPEIAERAFDRDLALLVDCDATTVELSGVQYRVQVENDSFTEEQSSEFACADQSALIILQLFNDEAVLPYIGQTSVSFRCGRNITVTALTTTIDLDDLSDANFFDAAATSNLNTGALPGS